MIGKMNLCLIALVLCAALTLAKPVQKDPLAGLTFDSSLSEGERCAKYAEHAKNTLDSLHLMMPLSEAKWNGALYLNARLAFALSQKSMSEQQEALLFDIKRCVPAEELKGIDLDAPFQ